MIKRSRITANSLVLNYVSLALSFISGIVLIPTYLDHISIEDYGYWLASGELLAWLVVFDPGIAIAVRQKVAHAFGRQDYQSVGSYMLSVAVLGAFILIIFGIGGYILFQNVDMVLQVEMDSISNLKSALIFGLVGTVINLISFPVEAFNSGVLRLIPVGVVNIFSNVLRILVIFLVLQFGFGLAAIGIGICVYGISRLTLNGFIAVNFLQKSAIDLKYSRNNLKELLSISGFSVIGGFSNAAIANSNMFFAARLLGAEYATILKINQSGPEIAKQILERPIMAMNPSLSHLDGEGKLQRLSEIIYHYLNYLILALGAFTLAVISFTKPFVLCWVGVSFFVDQWLVYLIATALVLRLWDSSFSNLLFSLGFLKKNYVVTFCFALVYLFLILMLVPSYGLYGFFYASVGAELVTLTFYYPYVIFRKVNFSSERKKILAINMVVVLLVTFVICLGFSTMQVEIDSWVKLFFFSALVLGLYFLIIVQITPYYRTGIRHALLKLS